MKWYKCSTKMPENHYPILFCVKDMQTSLFGFYNPYEKAFIKESSPRKRIQPEEVDCWSYMPWKPAKGEIE